MNDLEEEFTNLDFEENVYDELPEICYLQIQSWMVNLAHKYNLALNELMIYAVIHSFSQDGVSVFRGSRDYLRLWAFCGRTSVFEKIKKLMDLNLIGREYVSYKGRKFPTYFSYAGRTAVKKAVQNTKKKGKKTVQNLNSESLSDGNEFRNWTDPVQNLNGNSPKSEHNNNLNKNLNNAAAKSGSGMKVTSVSENAAAAFLISKLKENLGCNPFSDRFVSEMSERFKAEGFDDDRAGEYICSVTEKVKAKNPDSIHAMFKKLVLADDVIADFVLKNPVKAKVRKSICPVCGKELYPGVQECGSCGFDLSYRFDRKEVSKAKKLYALSPSEKKSREEEIRAVMEKYPVSDFRNFESIKNRKSCLEAIDRKYIGMEA